MFSQACVTHSIHREGLPLARMHHWSHDHIPPPPRKADPPPPPRGIEPANMVNVRAVCLLLECTVVLKIAHSVGMASPNRIRKFGIFKWFIDIFCFITLPGVVVGLFTNPMWVVVIRMRTQKARTDSTETYYNGFIGNFVVVFLRAKYR